MSDTELLHEYVATGSAAAFAELVERYINLVYSAARRQVRDAHLAEDITQAVFTVLARKAAAIRNPGMLGPWLVKTARQTSCNAIRLEQCRRRHEEEGAIMKMATEPASAQLAADQIEAVLDDLLSRLGSHDRGALVLRFLQDKSVSEVAMALKISSDAAQKRITRALSRLRSLLARRGIFTTGDALELGIGAQVLHQAPARLMTLVKSGPLAKSAGAGSALAQSVSRIFFWARVKALAGVFTAGGSIVILATVFAANPKPQTHATTRVADEKPLALAIVPATAPSGAVLLANDAFRGMGLADEYQCDLDPDTLRTPESKPAGHIKSLIPNIPKDGHYTDFGPISGRRVFIAPVSRIKGKRVRITGWLKTADVNECCGIYMEAVGLAGNILARDEMEWVRPIHGDTDWTQYQMVQDIPADATTLAVGAILFCTGEVWCDDFQVQIVGNDVPVTDNEYWQMLSPLAERYSMKMDPTVEHDGHPTMCFSARNVPFGGWANIWHDEHHPDPKYLGHRIRMSAWIKSAGVTGGCGLGISTYGLMETPLTNEGQRGQRPITGTKDWKEYTAEADVPAATTEMSWAVIFNGHGKLWIDLDSVKVELADDADNPPAAGH